MRSLALKNFTKTEQGDYEIYLGNSTFHRFPSQRAAKAFLAETSRFLQSQVIELNEIYIVCFGQYRHSWFIFRNFTRGRYTNYAALETKIKISLDSAGEMFDRVHGTLTFSHDNAFTFINTAKICFFLDEALEGLIKINQIRNNTVIYHTLAAYQDRVKSVSTKLKMYGK